MVPVRWEARESFAPRVRGCSAGVRGGAAQRAPGACASLGQGGAASGSAKARWERGRKAGSCQVRALPAFKRAAWFSLRRHNHVEDLSIREDAAVIFSQSAGVLVRCLKARAAAAGSFLRVKRQLYAVPLLWRVQRARLVVCRGEAALML